MSLWQIRPQSFQQHHSVFRDLLYRKASKLEGRLELYLDHAFRHASDKWVNIAAIEHRLPPLTPDEVWALNDHPEWRTWLQYSLRAEQRDWKDHRDEYMAFLTETGDPDRRRDPLAAAQSIRPPARALNLIRALVAPSHPDPISDCFECEPCALSNLWREDRRQSTPNPRAHVPHSPSERGPDSPFGISCRFQRVKILMANAVRHNEKAQKKACHSGSPCHSGRCNGTLLEAFSSPTDCHHAVPIAHVLSFVHGARLPGHGQNLLGQCEHFRYKDFALYWAQRLLSRVQRFKAIHERFQLRCSHRQATISHVSAEAKYSRTQLGPWKLTPGPSSLRQVSFIDDKWPEYSEWPDLPVSQAASSVAGGPALATIDELSSWHTDAQADDEGEDDEVCEHEQDDEDEPPAWRTRRNAIDLGYMAGDRVNSSAATAPSVVTTLPELRPSRQDTSIIPSIETSPSDDSLIPSVNVEFRMPAYRERVTPSPEENERDRVIGPLDQTAMLGDSSLDYLDFDKIVRSSKPPSPPNDENVAPTEAVQTSLHSGEAATQNVEAHGSHTPSSELSSSGQSDTMPHLVQAGDCHGGPSKRDHAEFGEDSGSGRNKAPRITRTKLPERPKK